MHKNKKNIIKDISGVNIFLLILIILMILTLLGYFITSDLRPKKLNVHSVSIEDMIVTIPNTNLHIKMGVELETETSSQLKSISKDSDNIKKDIIAITETFSEESATLPDATEVIKKKIKKYLEENYPGVDVIGIYFNDYVTQ